MNNLCMLAAGFCLAGAMANALQENYLSMALLIAVAVFNIEMGARDAEK